MDLIDLSFCELYKQFGSLPAFDYKKIDGICAFKSNLSSADVNYALITKAPSKKDLDELRDYFGELPFVISVDQSKDSWKKNLEDHGFSIGDHMLGMALKLEDWKSPDIDSSLEVVCIENRKDLSEVFYVESEGFGTLQKVFNTFFTSIFGLENLFFYIVYLEEEAISAGLCYFSGEYAFISYVTTISKKRRRGAAKALISEMLKEAKKRGCKSAVLQSTEMGKNFYKKLGFEIVGEYNLWKNR